MKSYIIATGTLFALIALAHIARTVVEWSRIGTDPWFALEGPGIGIVAGALCVWAVRLLRVPAEGGAR